MSIISRQCDADEHEFCPGGGSLPSGVWTCECDCHELALREELAMIVDRIKTDDSPLDTDDYVWQIIAVVER